MKQNCFIVIILYKCILWTDSEISARPETFGYKYINHSSVLSVYMIHVYVYELGRVCAVAHVEVRGTALGVSFVLPSLSQGLSSLTTPD